MGAITGNSRANDRAGVQRAANERPTFKLTLRAEPGVDATRALRHVLKFALRRCRLRCVAVEEVIAERQ